MREETYMKVNNKKYKDLSKKELIDYIEGMEEVINNIEKEKNNVDLLKFPWIGNLGNWSWLVKINKVIFNEKKATNLGYETEEIPEDVGFEFFTNKLHPDDYDRVMENMIDIDNFKTINDSYGHNIGDEVLKKISEVIMKRIRKIDILSRIGGDEFMILLPETRKNDAVILAKDILKILNNTSVEEIDSIEASFLGKGSSRRSWRRGKNG